MPINCFAYIIARLGKRSKRRSQGAINRLAGGWQVVQKREGKADPLKEL
jgi:hypothetical protein